MPIQTQQPSAKIQGKQGTKDAKAYLAQLDELLKRNKGTGTHIGADTSSNTPMYIPGKVANPTGLGDSASAVFSNRQDIPAPTPVERPAPEVAPQQPQQSQPISINDFLDAFEQSYSAPENQPTYGTPNIPDASFIASTPDGGNLMTDGTIVYDDGTIRNGDPNAIGIYSLKNGSTFYSDGSVRRKAPEGIMSLAGERESVGYDDGTARWGDYLYGQGQPVDMPGSTQGLISGLFGQDRPITQQYGNVNPIEPTPGNINYGTDIRTKDLQGSQRELKLPVGAEVVQVLYDDGTQFGKYSGHQGYGNSILVRLPTGEMLRFSHMSQMADVQPGQKIEAGQTFGIPGTTGNTRGEHLDLEYYNQQGQIDNPVNFSGFSDPQGLRTPLPGQPAPGTLVQDNPQPTQSLAPQSQQSQQSTANVPQAPQNVFQEPANQIANTINKVNPTGNFDLGITETLQGKPEEARAKQATTLENIGTAIKAPELQTGELSREQGTNPFRQLAGNLIDTASTPLKKMGLPDFGISEAIAGGKTVNTDANLAPQASANNAMSMEKKPQDYAKVLGQNINDSVKQAGAGIQSLARSGVGALENVFKPKEAEQQRAVGAVSGEPGDLSGTQMSVEQPGRFSSLMDTTQSMQSLAKNDIRDPFFKSGMATNYQDLLKPNAESLAGGALNLDLFTDKFFQNKGDIANVFGGTSMEDPANQKFETWKAAEIRRQEEELKRKQEDMKRKPGELFAEWMKRTGGQSQLDAVRSNPRLHFDEKTGSVAEVGTPGHPSSKSTASSGPGPMKPGESVVEWMKRTGQQSSINAYGGPQQLIKHFGNSMPNVASTRAYQTQTGFGVPILNQGGHIAYPDPGQNLRIDSDNWITPADNVNFMIGNTPSNLDAPVKTPSASVNYGSLGNSNIFKRSKEFLNNIFRR